MSKSDTSGYDNAVFKSWLEIHKRSATTYHILSALSEKSSSSKDLHGYINSKINGHWSINEKSMHRVLRRLNKLELVSYKEESLEKTGLKKKVYQISDSGQKVLSKMQEIQK